MNAIDFLAACEAGDVEVIKKALAAGLWPSPELDAGWPPLHRAAWSGSTAAVALILQTGVPVDVPGLDGATALIEAAMAGNEAVVRQLISASAMVDARDERAWTPLMHAAMMGHQGVVVALLEAGADPSRTSGDGQTAAGIARLFDHPAIAATIEARAR